MAIAEMKKLELSVKAGHLDETLQLIQRFQSVHIETSFESTIPHDKKTAIEREIRTIEKNLQDIQSALSILKGREPAKAFGMLRSGEEKSLTISELGKLVEESNWKQVIEDVIHTDRRLQNNRTRRHEIIGLFGILEIWEPLRSNPLEFKMLHRTTALYGSAHVKHAADFSEGLSEFEENGLYYEQVTQRYDRVYYLIVFHNDLIDAVHALLNEFSFSSDEYPFNASQAKARADLEAEEAELIREESEIGKLIDEQSVYDEILRLAEDHNLNMLLRKKKSLEVIYDGEDIMITGWIISDKCDLFKKTLSESIPHGEYILYIRQISDRDIDAVPIKLRNNFLVTVYERLTEMYSLPRYDEIDPTPVMTVFYMLFYGLMVADIGYGIAVFLVGLIVKKLLKVKRSTRNFVDFLYYLSFPIMAWGLVYGSFFGFELPFGLISARADIIQMTVLSIVMGYLHIMAGLVLYMLNKIKLKQYLQMLSGGLSWFLAFLGGGLLILTSFTTLPGGALVFWAALFVTVAGLGMIILVPAVTYGKRWYAGVGKGLYTLYGATSYLGDFVSYTRLMALGVAGGSVAHAFNTILTFLPLAARVTLGVLLAVALHGLNMFLSMLSAYVHGIRLQFIEFFNKFYTGGGRKFVPFKAAEKNVIITDVMQEHRQDGYRAG